MSKMALTQAADSNEHIIMSNWRSFPFIPAFGQFLPRHSCGWHDLSRPSGNFLSTFSIFTEGVWLSDSRDLCDSVGTLFQKVTMANQNVLFDQLSQR
jgi:hypothetical protein